MDWCPYCGRDLRRVQAELIERFLRAFNYDEKLATLLRKTVNTTCKKATPYETLELLKDTVRAPKRVIERALDIYRKNADTRGAYSAGYFRTLLTSLTQQFESEQIKIPDITKGPDE